VKDYTVKDDDRKYFLKLAGELNITRKRTLQKNNKSTDRIIRKSPIVQSKKKFPYAICVKPCRKDQKAIACDLCERWMHLRCIDMCLLHLTSWHLALNHFAVTNHCITDRIPFSDLTNYEIQHLFKHVMNNVKHSTLTLAFDKNKGMPTEPDFCRIYYDQSSSIKLIENKSERD